MTTDITTMGPHALAFYRSRTLALESFGLSQVALTPYQTEDRSLAKTSRSKRALMISSEHDIVAL